MCSKCLCLLLSQCTFPSSSPTDDTELHGMPFEQIFANYFDYRGRHCLFIEDRFSDWADVFASIPGSSIAGAAALACFLHTYLLHLAYPTKFRQMAGPKLKQL